ncbi:unnamed protein product, partial [Didymodactylos carnosus]
MPSNISLIAGTIKGSIYVIKVPLTQTGIVYYLAHSARITRTHEITSLQEQEEALKRNQEFQMRQLEINYTANLQRLTEKFQDEQRHHEKQMEFQSVERTKANRENQRMIEDLTQKHEYEKQQLG